MSVQRQQRGAHIYERSIRVDIGSGLFEDVLLRLGHFLQGGSISFEKRTEGSIAGKGGKIQLNQDN